MKKLVIILAVVLGGFVILVLAGGPALSSLGLEVFCLTEEGGRMRLARCGGATDALQPDAAPPVIAADAQPTLIDTDMAVDDWLAILYLLQRPDVDVRAITVTGAGETHCGPGVRNALNLAALAGRPDIPVTCGREAPLAGERAFPQGWREHVDRLAGLVVPASASQPSSQGAAALIADTVRGAAGDIEIVTLGPLTNLADAFQADPALAEQVEQVYIMGGAFSVPGNLNSPDMQTDNSAAEWNVYVDPRAAALVVSSGAPITFVPLDATNQVVLDMDFYDRLGDDRTTPEAEFVYRALGQSKGFVSSGHYYFWDPLTAAIAADESLGTFISEPVVVVEGEGTESGATRVTDGGHPVRIATGAAGERFKQRYLDALNGRTN